MVHPIRKDINKVTNQMAVINSIKNIILTSHYEKPFQPEFGSNVRKLLFENLGDNNIQFKYSQPCPECTVLLEKCMKEYGLKNVYFTK